jgi:transposase
VQQKEVVEKAKERRRLWYELWTEGGMSQQAIAEHCGVTRQVIYKEIKHYKDKEIGN